MTGELVTTEMFQDIPVRIIQTEKDRVIPLNDIAEGIGYDRSALQKIVRRNPTQFKPYSVAAVTSSTDGKQYINLCLTRDGITGVLMRLHTNKLKDPSRRERVEKFQHWAMETLGKAMDGKLQTPTGDVRNLLNHNLGIAEIISKYTGVNAGMAAIVAIVHTEDQTGADLHWARAMIPVDKTRIVGHLNPTAIGQKIGKSPLEVNRLLQEMGFQSRDSEGNWQLTHTGALYGNMVSFDVKHKKADIERTHYGWRPLWTDEIYEKISTYQENLEKLSGRQGLLTGYIA